MVSTWLFRITVFFFLASFVSMPAMAGEPTDRIREITDKIIDIVTNEELKSQDKIEEKDRLVRKAIDEIFNWEEMCRRTLARNWSKRTEEEKKEFIILFGKLMENTYLDRIGNYSGEQVSYVGEKIDGNYALVKVKIQTAQETEIPVIYRLKKKDGSWLTYDVSIEGISLINNYRSQFNSIILKSSYENLIKKLRVKITEKQAPE